MKRTSFRTIFRCGHCKKKYELVGAAIFCCTPKPKAYFECRICGTEWDDDKHASDCCGENRKALGMYTYRYDKYLVFGKVNEEQKTVFITRTKLTYVDPKYFKQIHIVEHKDIWISMHLPILDEYIGYKIENPGTLFGTYSYEQKDLKEKKVVTFATPIEI